MSLRKMCVVLAVLSVVTALVGVWALVNAKHAADGTPAELTSLAADAMTDGKPVTLSFDKVMPYVCYISDTEEGEDGHLYRYYPVQYRTDPAKFVLLCIPKEHFSEMERYAVGKEPATVKIEGYLRKSEKRTQAAVDELVQAMTGLMEEDSAEYADLFPKYYVEPATLRTSALQRDVGLILLIGGLAMGLVGVIGIFAFRVEEESDNKE
ncbi:MAG: hypothetical protein J6Y26_04890 [Lachnospiraceae bacterium]|nr:hypothetical protein [Lachnospiraceae bacterium]